MVGQMTRPEHYITRAREIRASAEKCSDQVAKEQLLEVARQFEVLAAIVVGDDSPFK